MMQKTVGQFSFDTETNTLAGPAQYMEEQGNALVDHILKGEDVVFNTTAHLSPDAETAVLVRLQTDYAGWLGMKQVIGWLGLARPTDDSDNTRPTGDSE